MPDFNKPQSGDAYLAALAAIVENNQAALKMLDSVTGISNLPIGSKRWNTANSYWEEWSGAAWGVLCALYEIKVRDSDKLNGQTEAYYRNAGNLNAGTLPGARFADSSHGNRGNGSLHSAATPSANGFMSSSDKSKLDSIENNATADQTAAEIIALLLGVDGAGSGLDADLLDGWHVASVLARANHTGTQPLSTIDGTGALAALDDNPYAAVGGNKFPCDIAGGNGFSAINIFYSYATAIQFQIPPGFNGSLTFRMGLYAETAPSYGRIYKNGVAVGIERSTSSGSYVYWDENLAVNSFDLIELRFQGGDTYGAGCRLQVLGTVTRLISEGAPISGQVIDSF